MPPKIGFVGISRNDFNFIGATIVMVSTTGVEPGMIEFVSCLGHDFSCLREDLVQSVPFNVGSVRMVPINGKHTRRGRPFQQSTRSNDGSCFPLDSAVDALYSAETLPPASVLRFLVLWHLSSSLENLSHLP